MERGPIALRKWLMSFYLMALSKKGISAHQLHRSLDIGMRRPGSWRVGFGRRCATAA